MVNLLAITSPTQRLWTVVSNHSSHSSCSTPMHPRWRHLGLTRLSPYELRGFPALRRDLTCHGRKVDLSRCVRCDGRS